MGIVRRLTNFFRRERVDADIDDEIQAHLAMAEEDAVRSGMSAEDARRTTILHFGNPLVIRERTAEADISLALENTWRDLRHAVRQLGHSPVFTATVVATLAVGVGATAAIYTLIEQVMLRPLPVERPEALWRIGSVVRCCYSTGYAQDEWSFFPHEAYAHFRANTPAFENLAAFQMGQVQLAMRRAGSAGAAEPHTGQYVSGNFFRTFGVSPWRGRFFTDEDDTPGAAPVAVLSYRAWKERFGADSSVIGATYDINGHPFSIIGVASNGFFGVKVANGGMPDVWLPLATEPLIAGATSRLANPGIAWLDLIGRVRAGTKTAALEARLQGELRDWLVSHAADMTPHEQSVQPRQVLHLTPGGGGISLMRTSYESALRLLFFAALCVLLVACANIASLLLARAQKDAHQTALRTALGASRFRLVRKALIESLVISICGGLAALAVAYAGAGLILHLISASSDKWIPVNAAPSMNVLVFALGISVATSLIFGVGPAWLAVRAQPIHALYGAGRSTGRGRVRVRKILVIAQVALSVVVLSAAAMLGRSLRNLEHHDPGFVTTGRYLVSINSMLSGYEAVRLDPLMRDVEQRLRAIPGVRSAGAGLYAPMSGLAWVHDVSIDGRSESDGDDNQSGWTRVTPSFFESVGIDITAGRGIDDTDNNASRRVAVINESFAKRFFAGEDPIGKRFGPAPRKFAMTYEVVGVAANVHYNANMRDSVAPMYFVPHAQATHFDDARLQTREVWSHYPYNIVIWAPGNPSSLESQVRKAIADAAPGIVTYGIRSYPQIIRDQFSQENMIASLTWLFGAIALLLAGIGLYGVVAYGVEQRTTEIGVRMALGARQRSIVTAVLGDAFAQVGIGLALGIPAAIAAGRLIASKLFGVAPEDPLVLAGAAMLLAAAAVAATIIPARRAAGVSPMRALRTD